MTRWVEMKPLWGMEPVVGNLKGVMELPPSLDGAFRRCLIFCCYLCYFCRLMADIVVIFVGKGRWCLEMVVCNNLNQTEGTKCC